MKRIVEGVTRRDFLQMSSASCLLLQASTLRGAEDEGQGGGYVIGQPQGAEVGRRVLAEGGNAVDAVVAAALVSGVVAISQCGIGGYRGPMGIRLDGAPWTR